MNRDPICTGFMGFKEICTGFMCFKELCTGFMGFKELCTGFMGFKELCTGDPQNSVQDAKCAGFFSLSEKYDISDKRSNILTFLLVDKKI
jgi:hypothetical protein